MAQINISITEDDLKKLIVDHLSEKLNIPVETSDVKILVKSKQNYKSEWEDAHFKAEFQSFKL